MVTLSKILYFTTNHNFITVLFVIFFLIVVGIILKKFQKVPKKKTIWFSILSGCLLIPSCLNFLPGVGPMFINGPFLYSFGTMGSAIIINAERTNSQLNDNWVLRYSVVIKTAEGEDIETEFTTMNATYYPPSNTIVIPSVGERFSIKYIPGVPYNFVILNNDESSTHVIRIKCTAVNKKVGTAQNRYKANPENQQFTQQYIQELSNYVSVCTHCT